MKMTKYLNFVEISVASIWQRLEQTCNNDARSLGLFRIFWGWFILLFVAPYSAFVSQVPQAFYNPPILSLANLFAGFPPYWLMLGADLVKIWLVVLITVGIKTRWCTITFCLLTFLSHSFLYSFGKIDHDVVLWAVTLCLAFTDWGVYYALIPDRRTDPKVTRRALATAGVVIAFGFFTAGFEKALRWVNLDLSTGGFLSWFYPLYYLLDRKFLLAPLVFRIPAQSFKILDYTAVAFELSPFLFLFAGRTAWRVWLLVATCFHLANALLLNIPFYVHVLVYLPFISFPRGIRRLNLEVRATNAGFRWWLPATVCAVLLGAALTVQRLTGRGSGFLFIEGASAVTISLYVSLVLLSFCALMIALDLTTRSAGARLSRVGSRNVIYDNASGVKDIAGR
jgi:hypothetical protein